VIGLIAGATLMSGAFIAKRFILRLKENLFRLVIDEMGSGRAYPKLT
jgi:hypothetical protein